MKQAVITVYLRNGCSFVLRPTDPSMPPSDEQAIAAMMGNEKAIQSIANATPMVVLKWAEVVAVMVSEEDVVSPGNYA